MNRRDLLVGAAFASSLVSVALPAAANRSGPGDSLNDILSPYLTRYGLPALAAAAMRDGQIVASGAVGTRRAGADIPVTIDDRFHISSDTKAMTSLLAGMLIEEGALQWTTTVGDVFPELAATMAAGLRDVPLAQLLSHAERQRQVQQSARRGL